ncbi:MAG: hypothetical protein LDL06_04195, partial [Candidatus Nitrosotenuis sp.]|nr:hypothetical protein [Candidatus Nitrosotenuis sp.]
SSTVNINEDFPFPIKATIYKPTISHQNVPLQFTIELVDYTTDNFLDRFPTQTVPSQNESLGQMKDFEDDVMLNEKSTGEDTEMDFIFDELNATSLEEDNSNSTGINYLDAINLEKLFEMFLKEHFEDDDSDDQIIDLTVFLDFLNKTDSAIIGNQNSTGP